jgi:hypothetical protein
MAMRRESLESEATRFRKATEEYTRLHPEDRFTTDFLNPLRVSFPVGCCKSTSWMLAHHLTRLGEADDIKFVSGGRAQETHIWLLVDGFIVDLTADQFKDEHRPVIVVADGESAWHDTFKPHRPFPFDVPSRHRSYIRSVKIAALMQAHPVAG